MLGASEHVSCILIVEDDPVDTIIIKKRVSALWPNAKVISVGSLDEAERHYQNEDLDAVLLDLNLPDSKGADTVKSVRGHVKKIPVIVVTGEDKGQVWEDSMHHGANEVLSKSNIAGIEFADTLVQRVKPKTSS